MDGNSPHCARVALPEMGSVQGSHLISGGGLGEPETVTLRHDDVSVVRESADRRSGERLEHDPVKSPGVQV